ncbi:MAG: scavenger receptor cysteine-rich domain-containing protein, partial [Myxococcales bacterium]|nr:scavenger receptor cysteine-rich domain-containing protein [Myxococcales bacterium]
LRLADGAAPGSGRLEVYFRASWGTVCDDSFRQVDAEVACRQAGFPGAIGWATEAGDPGLPIWMDQVTCVGDEDRLADCAFDGVGIHNCAAAENVGVMCLVACAEDADCADGFTCQNDRCLPAAPVAGCAEDSECTALFSGWITMCAAQADCPGQVCVAFGEGGVCANAPSEFVMCAAFGQAESEQALFPEGDAVTVCAQTRARCNDSGETAYCETFCAEDAHCAAADYPVCDVDSGRCVCTADSCAFNASVCGDDGICRCAADEDCTEGNTDTCYDGVCGCSEATICPEDTFNPGTQWVCEGF